MVRKPQTGKIKLCQLCIRILGKSGPHLKEVVGNHYGKDMEKAKAVTPTADKKECHLRMKNISKSFANGMNQRPREDLNLRPLA